MMITDSDAKSWQVKTLDGINYQPDSLEVLIRWVFESRIGASDLVFSPDRGDWVAISSEPLLKTCFWQIRTSGGEVYGPVSLGELKQLFMNNQVNIETEISPHGAAGQWLAIKDLPALGRWLAEEYVRHIDHRQFLDELNKQFPSPRERISGREEKFSEKIKELKQEIALKDGQIKEFKLNIAQLEKDLEDERSAADEMKVKYSQAEPQRQAVSGQLQGLKGELQEKMLFIDELNKQMAQMEVADTIKDDEIRELKELLESVKGDIPAQLELLQQKLQDEKEALRQLQMDKELSQQNAEEEKKALLNRHKELEEDINKLSDEKEGLQNLIYTLQDDLTRATSEKQKIQETISELEGAIKSESEEKDRLLEEHRAGSSGEINILEDRIRGLREEAAVLEKRLESKLIKDAQIQALLKNKEQLIQELADREELLSQLKQKAGSTDGIYELEQERFSQQLKDMAEELGHREELIMRLETQLAGLKGEYQARLGELEQELARQAGQFRDELAQKTNLWESTFGEEKERWEGMQRQLEGELARTKAELESQALEKKRLEEEIISQRKEWEEIQQQFEGELAQAKAELEIQVLEREKLQVDISYKNKEWEDRLARLQEDGRRQYEELIQERENLQSALTDRIHLLEEEIKKLQSDLDQADKANEELLGDKNILQQELSQRDRFIEEIKREAARQEKTLKEKEEAVARASDTIGELEDKIKGLTEELQNESDIQNGLRTEINTVTEELAQSRQTLEQLRTEKGRLIEDLQRQKEDFQEAERSRAQELEEIKRNWEHALEENRSIQRQFYLEKQKLTKEYTETINKQAKLEKRNQLEREITDRSRMKEELERLYNLLKGNLEGLQQGASEIQSGLQQIQSDIDNKRLSLKYISESEKRAEKKTQFPKPESAADNTPAQE